MAATVEASKKRAYAFTENNPPRTILFPDGLPDCIKYLVYQLEVGESGTPHLQGYVKLKRPQRVTYLQKLTCKDAEGHIFHPFERTAFMLDTKGSDEQNKHYCTKPHEGCKCEHCMKPGRRLDGPWELGEACKGQGERTDLHEAAEILIKTGDINAIDRAVLMRYPSGCMKLASLAPCPRRDDLKIITIVGPTGIGKSYSVHDLFPDVYVVHVGNSGLWWDGYTGQQAVLFEEYKGQVQLQKMLQILDPYPLRLEIKGGSIPARFTVVFITSNSTPDKWYRNEEGARDDEMQALARRLDQGNPQSIPPRPDGARYIHVMTRPELHQRLNYLRDAGVLPPRHEEAAAARTPPLSDDEEPPRLRRAVAHITVDDAPDDADIMIDKDGEVLVRDDIAPQP